MSGRVRTSAKRSGSHAVSETEADDRPLEEGEEAGDREEREDVREREGEVHREGVHQVEAKPAAEHRHEPLGRQQPRNTVDVARHQLARRALRELGEEAVDLAEVGHPPLAQLVVLLEDDAAAAERRLVAGEDVLRQVDLLRRRRAAAAREEVELVDDVGVAVVHPHVERRREDALEEGAEVALLHRHQDRRDEAARLGEDVLGEADDRHRPPGAARVGRRKLLEQVAQLEALLKVAVLVHVDEHHAAAAGELQAEVLVLGLALADDRHPRQRDARELADAAGAVAGDQHRRVRLAAALLLLVVVHDAEAGERAEEELDVGGRRLAVALELAVVLAREEHLELGAHELERRRPREAGLLGLRLQQERLLVLGHPERGAAERLPAQRRPHAHRRRVGAAALPLEVADGDVARHAGPLAEEAPLVGVEPPQHVEERLAARALLGELGHREDDGLLVRRREDGDRVHRLERRRVGHRHRGSTGRI